MSKFYKITIVAFLVLVAFLTYLEAVEPKPVNWNPSYTAGDKIPLGTYILYQDLQEQNFKVIDISVPPYEFLKNGDPKGTYVFINNQLSFDDEELDKLLSWVENGNTLFLASDAFSKNLLDTLNLNVSTKIPSEGLASKPMLNLTHADFKSEHAYLFDKDIYHSVFSEIDTLNHTVLGVSELYSGNLVIDNPEVNFVRVPHGKGSILLNTAPQAFTNFFQLHDRNFEYTARALAYLPSDSTLYWDAYKKAGKAFQTSPLYILLSNQSLKWAYYLTLIGVLFFVLFEGKRKQRPIPIVNPLENQTYNFTRTVSGLYLDRKDYKEIATKKIAFFLEYVRLHYRLDTSKINADFYTSLSAQTGRSITHVKDVFKKIEKTSSKKKITKEELLALNSAIASLKKKYHGKTESPGRAGNTV